MLGIGVVARGERGRERRGGGGGGERERVERLRRHLREHVLGMRRLGEGEGEGEGEVEDEREREGRSGVYGDRRRSRRDRMEAMSRSRRERAPALESSMVA